MGLTDEKLLIFDGGCGSGFQAMELDAESFGSPELLGCNEQLNLSAPEAVVRLHRSFLDAGSQVLETNTFGANDIVLREYGLEGEVAAINSAAVAHAKTAIGDLSGRYIAGSVGPTTKLPALGQIDPAKMRETYLQQIRALVEAGVDVLSIETCQDLWQAKIALIAAMDVVGEAGRDVPVMLSVTVESSGTLLVGSDVAAVVSTFEPYPLFSLGLNCATGPEMMGSHVRSLSRHWPGRISVMPNAGIPTVEDGATNYPLTPEDYAAQLHQFVTTDGVSIVGGCCGTTPAHLRALVERFQGTGPAERVATVTPSLSSLYGSTPISQEIPPLLIGERMNANGSKKFRKRLLADDFEGAAEIGKVQENGGAHVLDLCTAYAGRDEPADITRMVRLLTESVRPPLMIDSTSPGAIETALQSYPGRCVINSVNLEDGGETLGKVCTLARRYGAAVVGLAIAEDGMAMTADDKIAVARRIHDLAVDEYGLRSSDLLLDMLTFTLGSGDQTLNDAAVQTLDAIRRVKRELPGVHTVLGVSNISFGLTRASRRVLNSMFLGEAISAGLDAAIVDASKILPLKDISAEDREVCLDLIHYRTSDEVEPPLTRFIEHFKDRTKADDNTEVQAKDAHAEQRLEACLLKGNKEDVGDLVQILLSRYRASDILNDILIPAMRKVGDLFGRGEMLLPFVLQSAEVMKRAVGILEPHMDRKDDERGARVLLATVKGDVHDIGKNLVDIILTNNGCEVHNLGTNVATETIIKSALELEVDAVGLSGLLVKSAITMSESLPRFTEAGLEVPVLLGGAALTSKFVAESCVPEYGGPVVYCPDAFAGLKAMRDIESGEIRSTTVAPPSSRRSPVAGVSEVRRDNPVPALPFTGSRAVTDIPVEQVLPLLNVEALIRGRWGFRKGKATDEEYAAVVNEKALPMLEELKLRVLDAGFAHLKVAYGYFPCFSDGEKLVVEHEGESTIFGFPRQGLPPHLCIADYFRTESEGGDVLGTLIVTVGKGIAEETAKLFGDDSYRDYLMLHGFGAELADALTEFWHRRMRVELATGRPWDPNSTGDLPLLAPGGARYGIGYPSCPDLELQKPLLALSGAGAIGVQLTELFEMVPEFSTSAVVVHHPAAKYFSV